ncbi:MAG TPA: glucose-1-phosphate cytidylyltransferase [Solirubrobacteraceae bacterium]|nr:glucose-1-phosphate cytidylyltransferase [Solirubrobacteraceae bacterium]
MILAGGLGSRLSEETTLKPKPMVEIGGKPILWHIMKIYEAHDVHEFVVCLGYKGYVIKEWFANYALHTSDVTFDMRTGEMDIHRSRTEPWRVTLVDTGDRSMTGGRLKRVLPYIGDETFCVTYGDGVANLDISSLVEHHRLEGRLATVTAVQPPGRFGALETDDTAVRSFAEKPRGDGAWINGGFFVCEPSIGEFIAGDDTKWEEEPLRELAARGELTVYRHRGFWQAMDTLRERNELEALWASGRAPWCAWDRDLID